MINNRNKQLVESLPPQESKASVLNFKRAVLVPLLLMTLVFGFIATSTAIASTSGLSDEAEDRMLSQYEAALAKGQEAAAKKVLLDHSERIHGENAEITIKLMHRYGLALSKENKHREATFVLIEALRRSDETFGSSGGEAFELNMSIGYAYSHWQPDLNLRMKYFEHALQILRDRGQRESMAYVDLPALTGPVVKLV